MAQKIAHRTVGSLWQPQATFTVGGAPTDPTNLTVRQQDAAGLETVLLNNVATSGLTGVSSPVAKVSTGVFKMNPGITLSASGYWFVKFEGIGTAQATIQDEVIVDPDEFTANAGLSDRALVGLSETKNWLQQMNLDVTEDLDLVRTINAVSQRLHNEAEREFKAIGNPQTRTFEIEALSSSLPYYVDNEFIGYYDARSRTVEIGDLTSATTVLIVDTDWTTTLQTVVSTDYTLLPLVRQSWEPVRRIEFKSTVTGLRIGMRLSIAGNWGFPSVPEDIKQAALDAIAAIYDRDVTHWRQDLAPAPSTPEGGTTVMIGGSQRILSLPPTSLAVAWSYRDPSLR